MPEFAVQIVFPTIADDSVEADAIVVDILQAIPEPIAEEELTEAPYVLRVDDQEDGAWQVVAVLTTDQFSDIEAAATVEDVIATIDEHFLGEIQGEPFTLDTDEV